jgi:NAD(P)-dependent dehydrogenase (short-subunit alcohol dehydrogenase family)
MQGDGKMRRFEGRTALVTGAASASGIGFATATRLAREGANVVLTDIDATGAAARAVELCSDGCKAIGLGHDVGNAGDWRRVIDASFEHFGPCDVLVNNAGIVILRTIDEQTDADWHRQIEVNLTSVFLGCRAVIAQMRSHSRRGSIVNVSSVAGLVGMRRCTAYAASKGGVRMMSKVLALETAAEGIRVNSVHPGVIETAMQQVATADGSAQSSRIHAAIPMQRMGRPCDVAATIVFLASDEAAYSSCTR